MRLHTVDHNAALEPELHRPSKYEFSGLDMLRLVACTAVLLYHFTFRGAARDAMSSFSVPAVHNVTKYGFLGVDLFFIISGFVITYSAQNRSAPQFLYSRFVRIYPTFVICMSLSFCVQMLSREPRFHVTFVQLAANFAIAAPLFRQNFVDGAYWSIVYEVIFYGWIYLFILIGIFNRRLTTIVAAWIGVSLANAVLLHSALIDRVFLANYSGFFCIGIVIYHGRFHKWRLEALALMAASLALALIQVLRDINYHNEYYVGAEFSSAIAVVACVLMTAFVTGIVTFERCERRRATFLLAGGITYPLYLIHQNIGYIAFNKIGSDLPRGLLLLVITGALVAASWVIWRYLERPVQKFLKARMSQASPEEQRPMLGRAVAGSVNPL